MLDDIGYDLLPMSPVRAGRRIIGDAIPNLPVPDECAYYKEDAGKPCRVSLKRAPHPEV